MTPEDVGIEQNEIILTARSGRHALRHRLELVGYTFSDDQRDEFDHIYAQFLTVADRKKEVLDEDLHVIIKGEHLDVPEQYHLVDFQAVAGIKGTPMATVRLNVSGETVQAAANGEGPVAAAFNAIDDITKLPSEIQNISTTSSGRNGDQNVTINVGYHDQVYTGEASASDVVEASIRAYLNSLNKFVAKHSGVVGA